MLTVIGLSLLLVLVLLVIAGLVLGMLQSRSFVGVWFRWELIRLLLEVAVQVLAALLSAVAKAND